MTSKQRDNLWIVIKNDGVFLKHPRGEFTKNIDDAYGYHYKADAEVLSSEYKDSKVCRRKDLKDKI